jgi:hypothetical protein
MTDKRYVIVTVECPRCKTKQKVHVTVRVGFGQMNDEAIRCLNCDSHFNAAVPDKILRGPFPA